MSIEPQSERSAPRESDDAATCRDTALRVAVKLLGVEGPGEGRTEEDVIAAAREAMQVIMEDVGIPRQKPGAANLRVNSVWYQQLTQAQIDRDCASVTLMCDEGHFSLDVGLRPWGYAFARRLAQRLGVELVVHQALRETVAQWESTP